ncbi:pRL2-19 [Streptomyces sp. NPDC005402]|uniref:pRL2-19 n=1 Tax=Streptomyces sp. NPDC005402 TaxID=3155338 RepID=UPI0033A9D9F9
MTGGPLDGRPVRPEDLSHSMLVAVLMAHGGSLTIPVTAFEPDSTGGPDGSWHAVALEPLEDGTVRLSVRPRPPDIDGPGIRYE